MEEYTNALKQYLQDRRDYKKTIFKIVGTVCRGVSNGRFTYEQGLMEIQKLSRKGHYDEN